MLLTFDEQINFHFLLRFKKIATVAATRVETMRDLLVNWNFFLETKVAVDKEEFWEN